MQLGEGDSVTVWTCLDSSCRHMVPSATYTESPTSIPVVWVVGPAAFVEFNTNSNNDGGLVFNWQFYETAVRAHLCAHMPCRYNILFADLVASSEVVVCRCAWRGYFLLIVGAMLVRLTLILSFVLQAKCASDCVFTNDGYLQRTGSSCAECKELWVSVFASNVLISNIWPIKTYMLVGDNTHVRWSSVKKWHTFDDRLAISIHTACH